jgi:hypothetical protein
VFVYGMMVGAFFYAAIRAWSMRPGRQQIFFAGASMRDILPSRSGSLRIKQHLPPEHGDSVMAQLSLPVTHRDDFR